VKCRHLIFWLESQRGVYCHTAKLEPNRRVTIDRVPLLVQGAYETIHKMTEQTAV